MTPAPPPFVCPRCAFVSHHPKDASERYCAHCHVFVDDPTLREPPRDAILVVVAHPGQRARLLRIAGDLESLQTIVGGNIEMLPFQFSSTYGLRTSFFDGLHVYVNEDGRHLQLPRNLTLPIMDDILGPLVVSAIEDEGDEAGLTEVQAVAVANVLDRLRGFPR
jgi:uncharacterized protein DUF3846